MLDPGTDPKSADCCAVDPRIACHFDEWIADATTDTEFPPMVDVSEMLLGLVEPELAERKPSVLEIGCGSGALSVALLKRGAARARGMDLSTGMLATAVKRAEAADVADRAEFAVGDGAVQGHDPHDWVVLDRVICCYPNVTGLLGNVASSARERVAFSLPTSRGWRGIVNHGMRIAENLSVRLGWSGCFGYVHNVDRIEKRLAAAGFALRRSQRLGLWYAAVWDRAA